MQHLTQISMHMYAAQWKARNVTQNSSTTTKLKIIQRNPRKDKTDEWDLSKKETWYNNHKQKIHRLLTTTEREVDIDNVITPESAHSEKV